jgi:hypothetical protein
MWPITFEAKLFDDIEYKDWGEQLHLQLLPAKPKTSTTVAINISSLTARNSDLRPYSWF